MQLDPAARTLGDKETGTANMALDLKLRGTPHNCHQCGRFGEGLGE